MQRIKSNKIKEASFTDWSKWFAWYPVYTEQDEWVWLKYLFVRQLYFPQVFLSTPIITQYSKIKKSRRDD